MNKIKSISILGFSIVILLCCTLPGFALAENTLQNNQIAVLYLYTKSSFDYHTFSKGEADVNGALDEGLLFTEWLKNKDFEPFKFGDEISGTIGIDDQIKMSNDILNHKYSYKVLEHDFGNDEFGDPINDKMVEFKLPEKVGRSFQVMTEIFLKINNAWNGVKNIDYTGNYLLINSENKATQRSPVLAFERDIPLEISVGAFKEHCFTYGDTFEFFDSDGILNRLGYWHIEKSIADDDYGVIKKGDEYISKVSYKWMRFINDEWVLKQEKICFSSNSASYRIQYLNSDYNDTFGTIAEGEPNFQLDKALFTYCSRFLYVDTYYGNVGLYAFVSYYKGRDFARDVLYKDDDFILNTSSFSGNVSSNFLLSKNIYDRSIKKYIDSWENNIVINKNELNKLNPTFEGSVREQWQTGEADFSKPYVDNFLPSRGWDYWALCGLLIEDFKNGYKNYYYLITFPVEGINEDGTMNLRNSFSTYEHIKETAPNDSILRNEAVGSGKYEDVKDNLPNDKNSIDFISYHINNLLSLPGLNSIVIFGLSFGLAVFVIGRRGF